VREFVLFRRKARRIMSTSLFEIFKIGIGPSSSHTVGPMIAARRFVLHLEEGGQLDSAATVRVDLYGSLAQTGKGHGTDRAVILGLAGEQPNVVDPTTAESLLAELRETCTLMLLSKVGIAFDEAEQIVFHQAESLPKHPNGMTFTARDRTGQVLLAENFYSIGGGFVIGDEEPQAAAAAASVPHEFHSAAELLAICRLLDVPIWQVVFENECALRTADEVRAGIDCIWNTMNDCIERGMAANGLLPGHLKVRRRAAGLAARLHSKPPGDPLAPLDWVSVFAMAVNEENAAGSRVVTAPTNGAAGIIPAVARYYLDFIHEHSREGLHQFFLTAAAIGILYKENASISGAEVGCQGEVGVAASMAAGGLVAALGGSNGEVEHAAEIAMEHHLGMTCDPIGGLVQIPCIERNAMGAVKAINACRMAMNEPPDHKVSLDQVIETMYRTGLDMQSRYKETSLAGLALNIIEC
jgi:L-serine dehydratase